MYVALLITKPDFPPRHLCMVYSVWYMLTSFAYVYVNGVCVYECSYECVDVYEFMNVYVNDNFVL